MVASGFVREGLGGHLAIGQYESFEQRRISSDQLSGKTRWLGSEGSGMTKQSRVPLAERRRTTRVDCCYQVECQVGADSFSASVVNMGLGGLRLLSDFRLQPSDSVKVRQATGGMMTVEVIWSRPRVPHDGFEAGVVYRDDLQQMEDSWVKLALKRLGFESSSLFERRRSPRFALSVDCNLLLDGVPFPCLMADLGLGGALVETATPIPGGDEGVGVGLEVQIAESLVLAARIVYSRALKQGKQQYGLCFDRDKLNQEQAKLVEGYLLALG